MMIMYSLIAYNVYIGIATTDFEYLLKKFTWYFLIYAI